MKTKFKVFKVTTGCLLLLISISSCEQSPDYKSARKEVMDLHDKLMIDAELAIRNKMTLDTLSRKGLKELSQSQKGLDTVKEKEVISKLTRSLGEAEESMMDWMQAFNPDIDGKSNDQAVDYFRSEKVKLVKMDSLFNTTLSQSNSYLEKFGLKKKDASGDHAGHNH